MRGHLKVKEGCISNTVLNLDAMFCINAISRTSVYGCMFCILLFNSVIYVFLLLCMLCSVYSVFIVPTGILRLPGLRFFPAFSSVERQMSGYNSQRRSHSSPTSQLCCSMSCLCRLHCSMYCLCVNVHCTSATGCELNCSKQIYHILTFRRPMSTIVDIPHR